MSAEKHLLLFPFPGWGHTRAICAFATKVVQARPIRTAILTYCLYLHKAEREIVRCFDADIGSDIKAMISVVAIGEKGSWDAFTALSAFNEAYNLLVAVKPLTCAESGKMYHFATSPDVVMFDPLQYDAFRHVRGHSIKPVKIIAWSPGNAAASQYSYTRLGNFNARITDFCVGEDMTLIFCHGQIHEHVDGRIIDLPGMQPFHDYEWWPQTLPVKTPALFQRFGLNFLQECDGVVLVSPDALEHNGIAAWTAWFTETKRPVHAIGPLLRPLAAAKVEQEAGSVQRDPITLFLDAALKRSGEHSLIFISFGSVFWPGNLVYVWTLFDILIELQISFIVGHASPFVQIPADISARVAASGFGLMSPWVPQETILAHAATGWFVTHCGQNSMLESLTHGVPMICWPIFADQPTNSANVVFALDAGFELVQVRTGAHGLRPMLRGLTPAGTLSAAQDEFRAVLRDARGTDGQRKRSNAERLAREIAMGWEEGGFCWTEIERFMELLD